MSIVFHCPFKQYFYFQLGNGLVPLVPRSQLNTLLNTLIKTCLNVILNIIYSLDVNRLARDIKPIQERIDQTTYLLSTLVDLHIGLWVGHPVHQLHPTLPMAAYLTESLLPSSTMGFRGFLQCLPSPTSLAGPVRCLERYPTSFRKTTLVPDFFASSISQLQLLSILYIIF